MKMAAAEAGEPQWRVAQREICPSLIATTVRLEGANHFQIFARITRITDGAVVPVNVGYRLRAVVLVVRISIDFIKWDAVLLEVIADLVLAAGGVDDHFPAL